MIVLMQPQMQILTGTPMNMARTTNSALFLVPRSPPYYHFPSIIKPLEGQDLWE